MNEQNRVTAIRLLREQEVERSHKNTLIRNRFGDRITIALTAECDQRDREIAAINATIELLDGLKTDPA